ncbi:MAG: carbohydrate ABC transporter permease, partial [Desulfuromusa sp.]|nr:carbohydrate ABC transporter permease [Desulfuromusa sp.]
MKLQKKTIALVVYFILLLLPIYWMLNMSFRSNAEIMRIFSFYPLDWTLDNYLKIFTDKSWYSGYLNSLYYVGMNVTISLATALPAAYAFSRYSFLGDKHLFFWLLTNRMAPTAVFLLPFFQLYSTFGL